jgi:DNA invertase Pin-like site-specific DNA recombinase
MLIGYMRVSRTDGSQVLDLQRDALLAAGVAPEPLYEDLAHHLVTTVHDLAARGVGLRVLTGQGARIDTTTAAGKLIFGIFAALAEFERELIVERTKAGLVAARARGRNGGRPYKMTAAKVRLAQAAMGQPETKVEELCVELGVTRQTLYRHVAPDGTLRADGQRLLERKRS